jgi:uncharacterized membrane protein YgcG
MVMVESSQIVGFADSRGIHLEGSNITNSRCISLSGDCDQRSLVKLNGTETLDSFAEKLQLIKSDLERAQPSTLNADWRDVAIIVISYFAEEIVEGIVNGPTDQQKRDAKESLGNGGAEGNSGTSSGPAPGSSGGSGASG